MRKEEVIIETDTVKVRVIEIDKNTSTAWHYHTELNDNCFCLVGEIKVHTKNPSTITLLKPGERNIIKAGVIHCIENATNISAKYLLVQGTGKLDFIASDL